MSKNDTETQPFDLGNWSPEINRPKIISSKGQEGSFYTVFRSGATVLAAELKGEKPTTTTAVDGNDVWDHGDKIYFAQGKWHRHIPTIKKLMYQYVGLILPVVGTMEIQYNGIKHFPPPQRIVHEHCGIGTSIAHYDRPEIVYPEWNAETNTPKLLNHAGVHTEAFRVSVAGNTKLGGCDTWEVDDLIIFMDTNWVRYPAKKWHIDV